MNILRNHHQKRSEGLTWVTVWEHRGYWDPVKSAQDSTAMREHRLTPDRSPLMCIHHAQTPEASYRENA